MLSLTHLLSVYATTPVDSARFSEKLKFIIKDKGNFFLEFVSDFFLFL